MQLLPPAQSERFSLLFGRGLQEPRMSGKRVRARNCQLDDDCHENRSHDDAKHNYSPQYLA